MRSVISYCCILPSTAIHQVCVIHNSDLCCGNMGAERILNSETVSIRKENSMKIFGPTKENQLWRIKTNNELNKLMKHQNIVNYIKALRLSWFGHVQRLPDSRIAKKIFKWTPLTTRPKQRWEDNVIQDIRLLNIKNWTACVQDRVKWKNIIEKAKTFKRES